MDDCNFFSKTNQNRLDKRQHFCSCFNIKYINFGKHFHLVGHETTSNWHPIRTISLQNENAIFPAYICCFWCSVQDIIDKMFFPQPHSPSNNWNITTQSIVWQVVSVPRSLVWSGGTQNAIESKNHVTPSARNRISLSVTLRFVINSHERRYAVAHVGPTPHAEPG